MKIGAKNSRGTALILAMLVAAFAAAVAVTLITDETRWLSGVDARRDYAQAKTLASAGVQWARHLLFEDQKNGDVDFLRESWAFPLPPTPLENGSIEGQIIDLQSRINLNNMLPSSSLRRVERTRFRALARSLNIDEATTNTIVARFTDPRENSLLQQGGDRKAFRDTKIAPLFDVGELAEQANISATALRKLAPHIIALPATTPLNVNTAGKDTLKASLPGISNDQLNELIKRRNTTPFWTLDDFHDALPDTVEKIDKAALAVGSSFFQITVRAKQGSAQSEAQAVLRRSRDEQWPNIVWKTVE
jgi:Type II secretory pathway, component PulK